MNLLKHLHITTTWLHRLYLKMILKELFYERRFYRIITKKQQIQVREIFIKKIKKKNIKKIQLNNYLFIIGRYLFGYIGTCYMYYLEKKKKKDHRIHIKEIIKYIYNEIYKDHYTKILLTCTLTTSIIPLHTKNENVKDVVSVLFLNQIPKTLQLDLLKDIYSNNTKIEQCNEQKIIQKIKRNNNLIDQLNYKKQLLGYSIAYSDNVWDKLIRIPKNLYIFQINYLYLVVQKMYQILYVKIQQNTNSWDIYTKTPSIYKRHQYENIYKLVNEYNAALHKYLTSKNFWKSHLLKKIKYTFNNTTINYIIQEQKRTQDSLSIHLYFQNIYNNIVYIKKNITKTFVPFIYNSDTSYINIQGALNKKHTLALDCITSTHKMNLLVQYILKEQDNTIICYVKTPETLKRLSIHFERNKINWTFIHIDTKIKENKYINPLEKLKVYVYLGQNDELNRIKQLFSNNTKIIRILLEYIPHFKKSQYDIVLYTQEDPLYINEKNIIHIQDRYNNKNLLNQSHHDTYKESTHLVRLYKNYIMTRIEFPYILQIKYYIQSLLDKQKIEQQILYTKTKKIIQYIKRLNKRENKTIIYWYEYIYIVHIQNNYKNTNKELCKYLILAQCIQNQQEKDIQKRNNSDQEHTKILKEVIYYNISQYINEICKQKVYVNNKKWTKDTYLTYKKQLNNLNVSIKKRLIELIGLFQYDN